MGRWALLPVALLLLAYTAWGATYYVDPDCTDTNVGSGTPDGTQYDPAGLSCTGGGASYYVTIADVNAATFSANDSILFKKGETWTAAITFPSSGSEGSPITIGTYGSGAQPVIDATGLDWAFLANGKSYLIFDGFDVRGGDATYTPVFIYSSSNNNIIRNNTVRHATGSSPYPAVFIYNSSNNVVDNNVVDNVYKGIGATRSSVGTADGNTISNNTVTGSVDYAIVVNGDDVGFAGATNTIVEHNTAYNNKGTDDRAAIGAFNPGAGTIFRYNLAYNNGDATHQYTGFWVDGDGNEAATTFSYNIAYGNSKEGFAATGNAAHAFYNNTSYHNAVNYDAAEINLFTATEAPQGYLIKNNIFVASSNRRLLDTPAGGTTGHAIDYNLWYGGDATPFNWGGTEYNYADYKTTSSQDAHSVNADPLFVSTVTSDFRLQPGSPAINAGVNVSLTTDYLGNTVPFNDTADLPDIGAYEWGYGGPILTTPADTDTGIGWPVEFVWEALDAAVMYQLQVDDSGVTFPSPEIDDDTIDPGTYCTGTECTYSVEAGGALDYSTEYWWRVRAFVPME